MRPWSAFGHKNHYVFHRILHKYDYMPRPLYLASFTQNNYWRFVQAIASRHQLSALLNTEWHSHCVFMPQFTVQVVSSLGYCNKSCSSHSVWVWAWIYAFISLSVVWLEGCWLNANLQNIANWFPKWLRHFTSPPVVSSRLWLLACC